MCLWHCGYGDTARGLDGQRRRGGGAEAEGVCLRGTWSGSALVSAILLVILLFSLPALANTYTVSSTLDDYSEGTLRRAIALANANPGADTIGFELPAGSVIELTHGLPWIAGSLTIDGGGPGAVELRGGAGFPASGQSALTVDGGENVTIRGLGIAGVWRAVRVFSGSGTFRLEACHIRDIAEHAIISHWAGAVEYVSNTVERIGEIGLHCEGASTATFSGNVVADCGSTWVAAVAYKVGSAVLSANRVSGSAGWGLLAEGQTAQSACEIEGNTLEDCGGGMHIGSGQQVTVADNHVSDTPNFGIQVNIPGSAAVSRNTVTNATCGIGLEVGTAATVEGNDVSDTGHPVPWWPDGGPGILLCGAGSYTVTGNQVHDVLGVGIQNWLSTGPTLVQSNTVLRVGSYGVYTSAYGLFAATGNTIEDCGVSGLFAGRAGAALVTGNEVRRCGAGLETGGGVAVIATGNLLEDCAGAGIWADTLLPSTYSGNTIRSNGDAGVVVAMGPCCRDAGYVRGPQTITQNSTYDNGSLGIDLDGPNDGPDRVTPNDEGDGDEGPNRLLNFPTWSVNPLEISGGFAIVRGTAPPGSTVELFAAAVDPTGYGEGKEYLTSVQANALGRFEATYDPAKGAVTATATDAEGNTSEFGTWLADTEAPEIVSITATPNVLWPPNHKMRTVTISLVTQDAVDHEPTCRITGVTCNEPIDGPGDGTTEPDYVVTGDLTLELRAERSGSGTGRVYTIAVECVDAFGNVSTGSVTVTVPHNEPE